MKQKTATLFLLISMVLVACAQIKPQGNAEGYGTVKRQDQSCPKDSPDCKK